MKKTLSIVLAVIIVAATLCGCGKVEKNPKTNPAKEFYLSEEPTTADKEKIEDVRSKFISCLEENKSEDAVSLFTKGAAVKEEDLKIFFESAKNAYKAPFEFYDGYYVPGIEISDVPIKVRHTEADKTYVELPAVSSELYCGMYVSEGEKTDCIITLLLTKESGAWKIAWVSSGDFKYNGEDATALFEKTKALYNEEKLISSYIYSCMLAKTFRPGEYMRYENDAEMEEMCYKLVIEVGDKFPSPIVLENTENSEVHSILITNVVEDGMIPHLLVKTDVPISDRDALVTEGKRIIDALEILSPGIRENFSAVAISVTNDTIDQNNPTPTAVENFILSLE